MDKRSLLALLALVCLPAQAQSAGSAVSNSGAVPMGNHMGQNNMTQDQFNKIQDYADQARRLTKEDKAHGKTLADLLAEDKAAATALAQAMPLSCDVSQAILAAQGPVTVDGKTVATKTYETACTNGMGYFLISQTPGKPYGFSCFAADATRAADVAAGKTPGAVCKLPPNADINGMATAVLKAAGTTCTATNHRWIGESSASNIEYNEIACSDGAGYVLISALPGSTAAPRAITCKDAAARGLACKLTASGAPTITIDTFREALAKHGVQCDATGDNVRVIGQESVQKRYVVEFSCPQQPRGLVAFIPLEGNAAPFETLDCPTAAAKRGVKCTLKAPGSP